MDDLELLRRFEPVLRFNRVELFLPSEVGAYVRACSLWHRTEDGHDVRIADAGDLDLERLARLAREYHAETLHLLFVEHPLTRREFRVWRRAGRGEPMPGSNRFAHVGIISRLFDAVFRLTLLFRGRVPRGAVAAGEVTYREHIAAAGTPYYGRVVREAGWTILQYWFFYPMNDWRSSFHGINDHEADWENLIVYLAPIPGGDLAPQWVAFSAHDATGDGLRLRTDDPDLEWVADHVVAYPGAGSHSLSPRAMDEAVRVDPPILRGVVSFLRRGVHRLMPWADPASLDDGLRVPFVDYHRGDGVAVGPGCDREWQPVVIDDDTPWVRDFSGRWGRDSRDPFGGESAPTGPKHDRDGLDRVRWEDPLGWAGMHKVDPDPDPGAAVAAIGERLLLVRQRIGEIDLQMDAERGIARREAAEVRALSRDAITADLADRRQEALRVRDTEMLALRGERRHLAAEETALAAAGRDGLAPETPRAHLARSPSDRGEHVEAEEPTQVRSRLLRIWAAVSTPLIIAIVVWLLIGTDSGYYWIGAVVGVLVVIGVESLARSRFLAFLGWVVVVVVGTFVVVALVQEWRLTLAVLLLLGALVLLAQNLRELRSHR